MRSNKPIFGKVLHAITCDFNLYEGFTSVIQLEGSVLFFFKGFLRASGASFIFGTASFFMTYWIAGPILPFMFGSVVGFGSGWYYTYTNERRKLDYALKNHSKLVELYLLKEVPEEFVHETPSQWITDIVEKQDFYKTQIALAANVNVYSSIKKVWEQNLAKQEESMGKQNEISHLINCQE